MWIYFLIMVGVVVLDQVAKHIVMATIDVNTSVTVIPGILNFTHIKNPGMAFGTMDESRWVFMILTPVIIAVCLFYLIKYRPKNPWMYVPVSMIVGGGIGNMIDRLFYYQGHKDPTEDVFGNGLVVDFIDFCAFGDLWPWKFNIADAFVVVSAFVLFFYLLKDIIKEGKEEKKKKAAAVGVGEVSVDETDAITETAEAAEDPETAEDVTETDEETQDHEK